MSVIFLLIPLSIVIAAGFFGAFIWAVRSGQYEDTCTPSMRVLLDEPGASGSSNAARNSPSSFSGERAGVRSGNDDSTAHFQSSEPDHPSPSNHLPVEGRVKSSTTRFGFVHAARFGAAVTLFHSNHS